MTTEVAAYTPEEAQIVANSLGGDVSQTIVAFRNGTATLITSIESTDFESKLDVVEAITTSAALDDNLNTVFELKNFVVQSIQMVNERTGVLEDVPRVTLIDSEGNAYHAISKGIFSALENYVGILGKPSTWEDGAVKVYATKLPAKVGKVMVLKTARKNKVGDKIK